jgi:hypothetical protein
LEVLRRLGLILFRVEVHEIRNDIFLARLLLAGREFSEAKPLVIDSRPSDAIALAVREKCAVYVSPRVLDQTGIPVEIFIEGMEPLGFPGGVEAEGPRVGAGYKAGETPGKGGRRNRNPEGGSPGGLSGEVPGGTPPEASLAVKRRRLQAELEDAVGREAYERAAEIRDLLILLDQQVEQERRGKDT